MASVWFLILVALCCWQTPLAAKNNNLLMGNPSGASANPGDEDNYLIDKRYFVLSYNNSHGTPNWVSWRLAKSDLGNAKRVPFYPDPDLPRGFKKVVPNDYAAGGFDRGHQCPHSDRSANEAMSRATFAMSNIVPQSSALNQKAWNQLEVYCRELVEKQDHVLYILCGPYGEGGQGKLGPREVIGKKHKVTVPSKCWKVIMVLDAKRGNDLKKVNEKTRLIAVIMPNDMTVGDDWRGYRVPVKEVEQLTGYTFFDQVPKEIIEPLKEKVDTVHVKAPKPLQHLEPQ